MMRAFTVLLLASTVGGSHAFLVGSHTGNQIKSATTAASKTTTRQLQQQRQQRPSTKLNGFLADFFKAPKLVTPEPTPSFDPVTVEPDFRVAALFLIPGLLLDLVPYLQLTLGPILTLLGLLFLVQTFRVRFVFDEGNALAIKIGDDLKDSGENVVVGGENRWDCNTIVNYDFFPAGWMESPFFGQPILVYFKETQTPSESWNEGPGKSANDPAKIDAGLAVPGQVHFFPAVCNAAQIKEEFEKRGCGKIVAPTE